MLLLFLICQAWLSSADLVARKILFDLNGVASSNTFKNVKLNIYDPCKIDELKRFVIYEPSHRPMCFSNVSIDLNQNPETNTGYRYGAKEVWAHLFDVTPNPQYQTVMNGLRFSITTHICRYYLKTKRGYDANPVLFKKKFKKSDFDDFNKLLAFVYTKFLYFDFRYLPISKNLYEKLCYIRNIIRASKINVTMDFEYKTAFRRVFAILNCIGCEKCRLWSKVQIGGLYMAFFVQKDYKPRNLRELVFFIQLMRKLTVSSVVAHHFIGNK